ncbi:MAG TPA: PAS domain S-box protein [Dokdonella sp.]
MLNRLQLLTIEDARRARARWPLLLESPAVDAGRVERTSDVDDAAELLRRHLFDAVLVDGADAGCADVVGRLCAEFPHVAVVALTGSDERAAIDALEAGAQDALDVDALDADALARALRVAITRQHFDAERRQAAADHRVLFDEHPYAWFICDRHTLRVLDANEAAVALYGYSRAELTKMTLLDLGATDERERMLELLRSADAPRPTSRDVPQRHKGGRAFWAALDVRHCMLRGRPALMALARDVTLRRRAVRALEFSELRFRKLFQYSLGFICTHDMEGTLLSVNPAAARSLGYTLADLLGRRFPEFMPERHHAAFAEYLLRIAQRREDSGAFRLVAADGRALIWEYHNVLDEDEDGQPYVLGHGQDVTDRVRYARRLEDENQRDPLTGCFNRRVLLALERQPADAASWGAIVVDLDRFKQINDTFGHARGDEVLAAMGRFLIDSAGAQATVIRTGGDEFVLVVRGDAAATERIARVLEQNRGAAPSAFSLGWSVRHDGEDLAATIRRADAHLYAERAERGR